MFTSFIHIWFNKWFCQDNKHIQFYPKCQTLYVRQAWGEKENLFPGKKMINWLFKFGHGNRFSFYFLIKPGMEVIWKQLHLQATVHYQITVWIKREGHRWQLRDRVLQKSSSVSVLPRSSNNVIIVIGQTETWEACDLLCFSFHSLWIKL